VNLVEYRAAGRHVEVGEIRLIEQVGGFLVDAIVQIGRFDEAAQLVCGRERLRHLDDARLRISIIAGSRPNRIRHAAPGLNQPFIETLPAIPG